VITELANPGYWVRMLVSVSTLAVAARAAARLSRRFFGVTYPSRELAWMVGAGAGLMAGLRLSQDYRLAAGFIVLWVSAAVTQRWQASKDASDPPSGA
jgi:hypothetical protein